MYSTWKIWSSSGTWYCCNLLHLEENKQSHSCLRWSATVMVLSFCWVEGECTKPFLIVLVFLWIFWSNLGYENTSTVKLFSSKTGLLFVSGVVALMPPWWNWNLDCSCSLIPDMNMCVPDWLFDRSRRSGFGHSFE